jgi:hypothetical protein
LKWVSGSRKPGTHKGSEFLGIKPETDALYHSGFQVARNSESLWVSGSQKPETHFKIHFHPFFNVRECLNNLLLSFHRKLRVGSGFSGTEIRPDFGFPRTENPHEAPGSEFLETRNPLWIPVPGNPEPERVPRSWERKRKLTPLEKSMEEFEEKTGQIDRLKTSSTLIHLL